MRQKVSYFIFVDKFSSSPVGCISSLTIDKYRGSPITGTCKCLFYFSLVFANASHFTAVPDSTGGHKELYSVFEAWFYSHNNSCHTCLQEASDFCKKKPQSVFTLRNCSMNINQYFISFFYFYIK